MASKRVGDIYKITVDNDFYIGSTWDFDHRLATHKSNSKTDNQKLYKAIRDNNNQFEMTLLYKYECYTDTELRMEERKCYDELKPNLNMQRPYVSKEEFIEDKKQQYSKYKDMIKKYNKQYKIENRETILEKQRQHYEKNRETILEKKKEYKIKNKEKFLETTKKCYIKHRVKQLKQTKERRDNNKYICGCGSRVLNVNSAIKNHEQCKKHQKYLLQM
tara:strand:- start:167 stop:820 length:654 start_codon:yes stop_codon:yes gene_type:complete